MSGNEGEGNGKGRRGLRGEGELGVGREEEREE